jgi:ADP-ribose pyrophosphatase
MATIYRGRVFSVEVERMRFPNGREHTVEVVRHPPSVVLAPIRSDGLIVLVRQYRASIGRETWELPAGSLDPGETAEAAAARECEEEIGLVPHQIERIRGLFPAPGFCDEELIFFRVSDLRPPAADSRHARDEDEDIQVQSFPIDEARSMVDRGLIVDLKTAYALLLV